MFIFTENERHVDDMRSIKPLSDDGNEKHGYNLIDQTIFDTATGITYYFYKVAYDAADKPSTHSLEIHDSQSNTIKYNSESAQAFWMQLSYVMSIGDNLKHPERKEIIRKMRDILK